MNRVKLSDVYKTRGAREILYRLLKERIPRVNISHRSLPAFKKHLDFIRKRPYKAWYLISEKPGSFVGGIYLSKNDEIGILIFKKHQKKGFGEKAVNLLMKRHRGVKRFLANINPANVPSIRFFEGLKFRHIQNTYEYRK